MWPTSHRTMMGKYCPEPSRHCRRSVAFWVRGQRTCSRCFIHTGIYSEARIHNHTTLDDRWLLHHDELMRITPFGNSRVLAYLAHLSMHPPSVLPVSGGLDVQAQKQAMSDFAPPTLCHAFCGPVSRSQTCDDERQPFCSCQSRLAWCVIFIL